ncbi:unnamed protein product [Rhodiola kirilowii]
MEMMFEPSLSISICFANPPDQVKDDHSREHISVIENWMMHPNPGKNPVSMNVENSHIDKLSSMTIVSSSQFSTTSCASTTSALKYVYQRSKNRKQYVIASSGQTVINKQSGGFSSAVISETKSVTAREENAVSEFQLESSKSNLDVGADPAVTNLDELLDMDNPNDDKSEKDFCISFLRKYGLQMQVHIRKDNVEETPRDTGCSRSCEICGRSESSVNLLICDSCDNAYHARCCRPRVTDIPDEEWFCNSCMKKKQRLLKEMKLLKLQKFAEQAGNDRVEIFDDDLSCLDIMLLHTEPHRTEVRVGKGFQADVPEWSGPKPSECDMVGEALETNLFESERLHISGSQNPCRMSPIGNWLQCREVMRGIRKDIDGTVCGKWRRAPLFEVQTDDWNCFSAMLWDPCHADCAAPQEVETEEVMRQLKHIQMLKRRLTGKCQKLSHTRSRTLQGP